MQTHVGNGFDKLHERITNDQQRQAAAVRTIMWSGIALLLVAVGTLSIIAFSNAGKP